MKKIIIIVLIAFLSQHAVAGIVDTIEVYSNSMKKNIRCCLITPSGMKTSENKYPVIYLLHGYSGNYAQWITRAPQIQKQVDELQVIIVCPDGGYGSWYLDSPVDPSIRYETFISQELVQYVDQHYPTKATRQSRAITGLSMGVDCGVDDFFITVNRNLHAKLMEKKIEHDYIERPGEHNAAYWKNSIDYQLLYFKKFFERG
jgi:S-formylglutathione hydrolase FrmB